MVYRSGQESRTDWSSFRIVNGRESGIDIGSLRKLAPDHTVREDFFKRVCKPGLFFIANRNYPALSALDTLGQDDAPGMPKPTLESLACFQVVHLNPTAKRQPDTAMLQVERAMALPAMVQVYQVVHANDPYDPCPILHVRLHDTPAVIDMMDFAGHSSLKAWLLRGSFRQWTLASSTSGSTGDCDIVDPILVNRKTWHCLCLTGMCLDCVCDMCGINEDVHVYQLHIIMYVRVPLDEETPMYFILKIMATKGWTSGKAPLQHTAESELKLGAKMHQCVAKRAYLQCLVTIDTLREHGLEALPSGRQQGYYKSVLASKFPATVKVGQKADYYVYGFAQEGTCRLGSCAVQ